MHILSLIDHFKEQFECDTIRISVVWDKMFLMIGFNRNTKDDPGQWNEVTETGEMIPRDWDYIQETVIASGKTITELIKSADQYKKLQGMTWEQFFNDPIAEEIYKELNE